MAWGSKAYWHKSDLLQSWWLILDILILVYKVQNHGQLFIPVIFQHYLETINIWTFGQEDKI